ncbi:MAG: hypothetical protein B6229_01960 [Spirochaetaceae bacterium 4572_7]|nr:MAG: hypothetical protein B6229_01960 [Spirochaetaceae bacterium 4572_7]
MKNVAIVNLIEYSPYFFKEIDGKSQIDRIVNYAESLPNVEKIIFLLKDDILDDNFNKILKTEWNQEDLISLFAESSNVFSHLFYFYGDSPLLDIELSKNMYRDHINYYAEYTFADGYPYGLTPEILDVEILPALKILAKGDSDKISRSSVFDIVKKDINSFELETTIAEDDLRLLRISLTSDTKRNFNLLNRVVRMGGRDAKSITNIIKKSPEILMVEPSYVTIDITHGESQQNSFLPKRGGATQFMSVENISIIADKIIEYSGDVTYSFVPEYEATTHPDLMEIIRILTKEPNANLFLETTGLGWTNELKKEIKENEKLNIIITLDALDPELYRELRGDRQAEATAFAKEILTFAGSRVWIQATRMKTNEKDMEQFYRYWQQYTKQIIVQKYSDYNGKLPDLKVADLSPLKRFPCWHLKRDLHINIDGDVVLCFNDIDGDYSLGSILSDSIEDIMIKKREYYTDHIKCVYSDFCRKCDEYYTFNF